MIGQDLRFSDDLDQTIEGGVDDDGIHQQECGVGDAQLSKRVMM